MKNNCQNSNRFGDFLSGLRQQQHSQREKTKEQLVRLSAKKKFVFSLLQTFEYKNGNGL